jgi:restriction endonuclease S subunit
MIIGIGATIGKVALISASSSCNQQINIFTPDNKILPEYLLLFMKRYEEIIIQIAQFTTLPIFNQTRCGILNIAIPPKKEQLEIITFIKDEIKKVKTAQSKIEKQIDVLLHYKKSMIHEVVTGKKQVYGLSKEKLQMQTA